MSISRRDVGVQSSRQAAMLKDSLANDPVFNESYFYGLIPREEVEMMLLHDGEFLVRQSKKVCMEASGAVISVRAKGEVVHIVVLKNAKGYHLEEQTFNTIKELIEYYVNHRCTLTKDSGAILKVPIHRAKWVIHESQLKLILKLGEGQFGEVWRAELTRDDGFKDMVAVKRLKTGNMPSSKQKAFFDECRKLRQLKHQHLVNFKGVSMDSSVMLVMELCDMTLLKHLRGETITAKEELKLILHASRGMAYLASEKIIHRDLAGRNCLIKSGRLKISDLGMARTGDLYKMQDSKQKPLPIKWVPPDTLLNRNYTEKSDVWSFGVLMWEIATRGCSPYSDIGVKSSKPFIIELLSFLRQGNRLTPPPDMHPELQRIMLECWNLEPDKRPRFAEINKRLETLRRSQANVQNSAMCSQFSQITKYG